MKVHHQFKHTFIVSDVQEERDKLELLLHCWENRRVMQNLLYSWLKCSKTAVILSLKNCKILLVLTNFIEERESHRKWAFLSLKGSFFLIFRKDASKFLNQILKQQQKGNSKAGLGMSENLALNTKRYQKYSWN